MTHSTTAALSFAALAATAGLAQAAITGTGGQVVQIGPPASATVGALVGTPAHAWDEQQGFFSAGLPVDLSINPSSSNAPTAGIIAGLIDSHIIHWEDPFSAPIAGTVTFNSPIAGVAYSDSFLDQSDPTAGAGGTAYPTFVFGRGINTFNPGSVVSISGNTLTFSLVPTPGVTDFDQIRVYTRVIPTPGSMALLGVGGLLAARRRRA